MKNRASHLIFWGLILAVHLICFSFQAKQNPVYLSDSNDYLFEAANIKDHFIFYCESLSEPESIEAYTRRPPLYPVIILSLKTIWNSDYFVLLVQNLLSIFNIFHTLRFLKSRFPETEKTRIYLLPFILLYPAQAIYANVIMAETMLQTLLLLFFLAAFNFTQTKNTHYIFQAAFWLVLGIFTKPALLYFSLLFLFAGLYYGFRLKNYKVALSGLLPVICISLYCSWNAQRTGYFHFSAIKETNLLNYNTALFLQKKYGTAYSDSTVQAIETVAAAKLGFAEKQEYITVACREIILKHIAPYGIFHLKGFFNFFVDPGRFDIYTFFRLQKDDEAGLLQYFSKDGYKGIIMYLRLQPVGLIMGLLLIAILNALKMIAFIWFIFNRKFKNELRILAGTVVLYVAFITGPLGASRFALPVFPLILLATALFLFRWFSAFSVKSR